MTFETFDQSDEKTWPDRKVWIFWIYLWNFSGDNDDNEDNKDNEDSEDNKENEDHEDNRDIEDSEENDNSEDNDIEKTPWILEICETLITFLAIENNNLIIHSDPWIKSERDSIRNSCDVLTSRRSPWNEIHCILVRGIRELRLFCQQIQARIDEKNSQV